MSDTNIARRFEEAVQLAEELGFTVEYAGEIFTIELHSGQELEVCENFKTITEFLSFVRGYAKAKEVLSRTG